MAKPKGLRSPTGYALLTACVAAEGTALAVGVEEWELAADARVAWVETGDERPVGPGVGLQLQYGLTDSWAVRGALGWSRHDVAGGAVSASSAIAGVTYTLDVLRLVPFIDVGVGVMDVRGAVGEPRQGLGFDAGVGVQYLLSRGWAVGANARYQGFPVDLGSGSEGSSPRLATLGLRLARVF